jgi:hypothetical protein
MFALWVSVKPSKGNSEVTRSGKCRNSPGSMDGETYSNIFLSPSLVIEEDITYKMLIM